MDSNEHVQTAQEFLEASDREFDAGDILQGSEKLWGAATHALMAVMQDDGRLIKNHRELRRAVRRLAVRREDEFIRTGFEVAEKFHVNFYHGFMEDFQISEGREDVREFVERLLPNGTLEPAR